jgi:hypothetical protein
VALAALAVLVAAVLAGCGGSGESTSGRQSGAPPGTESSSGSPVSGEDARVALAQRTIGSYCLRALNHLNATGFKGMLRAAHRISGAAVKDRAAYRDDLRRAVRELVTCDPPTASKLRATLDGLP